MPLVYATVVPQNIAIVSPTVFANHNLNVFIQNALTNNPAILAAKANVLAAEERQHAGAQPLYNPELNGTMQSSVEDTASIGIDQTIDWVNKRSARAVVGSAEVMVAEAQLNNLRQQLITELLNALAAYGTNQQIVMLAKQRTQLLQQFVQLTRKRLANGDVPRVDVDLAELALSEALAQQADAEINLNQSLQTLRALTGLNDMDWPQLPNKLPPLHLTDQQTENLLYQLPLLQILNSEYFSAEARIRLAIKQRYPDPTLGFQGGNTKEGEDSRRLIGVTMTIPLFVRNPYRAEVSAANADAIEISQKRWNYLRVARAQIEGSAERYQILYQTTQAWQAVASQSLGDGMTLIERLWQAGEISTTDYLIQLKQRIDSQIAGAELQGRAWQAWVTWLQASGQTEHWVTPRTH